MARKRSDVPKKKFNTSFAQPLWDRMEALMKEGATPYQDYSAMLRGALEREIERLEAKKAENALIEKSR